MMTYMNVFVVSFIKSKDASSQVPQPTCFWKLGSLTTVTRMLVASSKNSLQILTFLFSEFLSLIHLYPHFLSKQMPV